MMRILSEYFHWNRSAPLSFQARQRESTLSSRRGRGWYLQWPTIVVFSVVLLLPCFWQREIQAGDLSSHAYNAWLVSLIDQGKAPGLWISSQSNNVLFDIALEWLSVRVGPHFAQKIAVSLCVLIFAWGTILFVFRAGGRSLWFVLPCVAMLSYGFIFHMGFFNFYVSMGICLWFLAIVWRCTWPVRLAAMPLLLLAWVAHPFPVVWAAGMCAYVALATWMQPRRRLVLLALGLLSLLIANFILDHLYRHSWSLDQIFLSTGTNQVVLFGFKYVPLSAGLLLIWLVSFRSLVKSIGIAQVLVTVPFQLWLLNAAAVTLLPDRVMFPQFGLPFGYIARRLSLAAAVLMCAMLAPVPIGRMQKAGLTLIAISFFGLLFSDDNRLNKLEDRVVLSVHQLPPSQRVVSSIVSERVGLISQHILDRACIGHCFSYANYEPSSRQFRIRAHPANGIVLDDYREVDAMQNRVYAVQSRDLPLYVVYLCGPDSSSVCTRQLEAGETTGKTDVQPTK